MKRIIATAVALVASALFAAAQPAREPYAPGLGEFMTATQLRHAKLWFAGKMNNWDLAAYEIDEIKEGLEDAKKQFPTHDGIPVADMIETIINPAIDELEKAVGAKSSDQFTVAFDKLTSACNTCHAGANKPFIRIQRPTESPLSNQNFAPEK
jgi:Spy/CpxP family protein refolding chaperone